MRKQSSQHTHETEHRSAGPNHWHRKLDRKHGCKSQLKQRSHYSADQVQPYDFPATNGLLQRPPDKKQAKTIYQQMPNSPMQKLVGKQLHRQQW